ncbi:putative nuclease HARBI1 [Aricia agestis]|uniref:putative nuclease HARBI1 n=1 Tax=Aricia agestis TaxID=91739 RepID=UPI001C20C393|nr:putative nuclease HARBI1 [Aricia agestis]
MSLSSLSSLSDHEGPTVSRRRNNQMLNAFEKYNDAEFRARFRLSKETVLYLESVFGNSIKPPTRRSRAIQPMDQILITLRFYATGSYQRVIGDIFNIEQPTVHRIVHRVTAKIASMKSQYINMPTRQECLDVAHNFYGIANFPRVVGAVDCTHIKINSPGGAQSELYRNRKGYFSLNVQMVCDSHLRIRNIVARWPGSVHDSTIFNDSPLCAMLERGDFGNFYILGDSGYPCRPYLLTPLLNPRTAAEVAYNRSQISTRNPVERLFGVLKRRFPCLQNGLGLKLENIPPIIVACAVLHNIAIYRQDELTEEEPTLLNEAVEEAVAQPIGLNTNQNFVVRTMLINTHFTN